MAPMPGEEAMSRGVVAEPYIQMMYLKDVNGVSDEASLDLLKGYRWEGAPQIVGTPDDIVIYQEGHRKIIDYKCPSAAVNEEYEKKGDVSFGYKCQVHQYGVLSKHSGVEYEGMDVCCFDPRTFKIVPYKIEYDPELEKEMLESSAILWNDYIMKGIVPDAPELESLDVEDDEFRDLVMQATALKMIGDEVGRRQKELLSRISAIGNEEHDLKDGKIDLEFASFTRNRKWDEDILVDLAEANDIDVEEYRIPQKKINAAEAEDMLTKIFEASAESPRALVQLVADMADDGIPLETKLDTKSLAKRLEEAGVDVTSAAGISEAFRVSTSKKQLPKVEFIRAETLELVDQLEEIVEQESDRMLNFRPADNVDDPDSMLM
jgi:energy-converting hydrogenase A subunit M